MEFFNPGFYSHLFHEMQADKKSCEKMAIFLTLLFVSFYFITFGVLAYLYVEFNVDYRLVWISASPISMLITGLLLHFKNDKKNIEFTWNSLFTLCVSYFFYTVPVILISYDIDMKVAWYIIVPSLIAFIVLLYRIKADKEERRTIFILLIIVFASFGFSTLTLLKDSYVNCDGYGFAWMLTVSVSIFAVSLICRIKNDEEKLKFIMKSLFTLSFYLFIFGTVQLRLLYIGVIKVAWIIIFPSVVSSIVIFYRLCKMCSPLICIARRKVREQQVATRLPYMRNGNNVCESDIETLSREPEPSAPSYADLESF